MKRRLLKNLKFSFMLLLLCVSLAAFAQTGTLTGKVIDSDGNPIIGANVLIVGTTNGTVTNIDGNYTLTLPIGATEISFSFMGYLTESKPVTVTEGSSQTIDITLVEDLLQLDDVVVIGYGTMKKSDLTGAVASVSGETLNQTTNATIDQSLQGRAAGIRVSSTTGAPGSNVNTYIRGITSINNSNAMWVVDGVPADPKTVNPNDVESIEVLKDASTAAIYGAAGGNGVIMVTTKKGKAGQTTATLNVSHGWQSVPESRWLDKATGPEYGQMVSEYQRILRTREDRMIYPNYDTLPTYDWQDQIFRTAPMQNYELGVSGGTDKSTFYLGLGYLNQSGILVKNNDYSKFTVRLNSSFKINNWLKVGANVSLTKQDYAGFREWQLLNEYWTPVLSAINYNPSTAPYDSTGNWTYPLNQNIRNPLSMIELRQQGDENMANKATAFAVLEPIKGLTYEVRVTGDINYNNSYTFNPTFFVTSDYKNEQSSIERGYGDYKSWQLQNFLTYTNSLFGAHNFSIMAGYESGEQWSKGIGAGRVALINETKEMWYFDASLNDTVFNPLPNGRAWNRAGYGYFGRINYDYKGIVLMQFNIRRDSDSRFGPRQRDGVFPSISAGWKFTEHAFVRNAMPFLNFGKIRMGAGRIGNNAALTDYSFFSTVGTPGTYDYNFADSDGQESLGAARNALSNPSIAWESVVTRNIGIDLGLLSNKLSITTEYFTRFNEGMIMQVDVPGLAGWIVRDASQEGGRAEPFANIGKMLNKGIEFSAGWKESRGKFKYSADFNFSYITTKAQDLPDTLYRGTYTNIDGYLCWTVPNGQLSEYYGYETDGIFRPSDAEMINGELVVTNQPYVETDSGTREYAQPDALPGDYRFKDLNGDHVIDADDRGPIGNPYPKYNFGLNLNLEYGWFDLNVFLQGATGFKIFNASKVYGYGMDGAWNFSKDYVDNHYRENLYDRNDVLVFAANTENSKYPRMDPTNTNGNFTRISDFYMESGNYLKVKNIQLGITLPNDWTKKVGVEEFRLYAGVQNALTFTKYTGYDPEVGSTENLVGGLDKSAYPIIRMVTFGANFKF